MTLEEKTQAIQAKVGTTPDGKWGPKTADAVLKALGVTAPANEWHVGKASSFADPADIRAFKKCKATGKSDQECFKVGDNGIGKWGDDTTVAHPMCALPPDDWEQFPNPRGKRVLVQANGRAIICELRDTMPRKKNIKNGAIIDLNPAAVEELGKNPPMMIEAKWRWAADDEA